MSTKTKSKPAIKQKTLLPTEDLSSNANACEPASWKHETIDVGVFNQIIHLSDIHIRPLQRHDEYYQVFHRLQDMIRKMAAKEKSVIVVTGDLFDHKTTFRPETFKVCRDFLKTLTNVAPVLLIAGNHDMLEQNTSRLDSLTPVIDDIAGVHYLKWSGVYKSAHTMDTFVVSSLYDKMFIRHTDLKALTPLNPLNPLNICLYHGDITRSAEAETRNRSKEDFDGFDAVLLGDIHLHQVFQNDRGCSIAYAGSLIQQNHGEPLDGHGFLVWNRTCDGLTWDQPRHYSVPNDYGFVDIHCNNGEWIGKEETIITLPKHCYARLLISDCTQMQQDIITAELKRCIKEDGSLMITKKHAIGVNRSEETCTEPNPDQTRKEDEIMLILDHAKEQGMDGEKLIGLHREYQARVDSVVCMSTAVWRPVWVEFKNLFGYGGGAVNFIRFKRGLTSISAGNACGKSSVVNALLFGIFGRAPLNPSSAVTYDVVNNREAGGYIKVLLSHGGLYYLIERHSCKPKTKTTAVDLQKLTKFDFTCEIWESNLNGDKLVNRCDTRQNNNDKFIVELVGDLTDFSLTNLLNKESSLDLLSMTPADQIKTLKSLFKMDVYDKYRDLNKKKIAEIESIIAVTRGKLQSITSLVDPDITDEGLDTLKQSLALRQGDLEEDEEEINRIQEEIQELQSQHLSYRSRSSRSSGDTRSLRTLQQELDELGLVTDPEVESLDVLKVKVQGLGTRIRTLEQNLKGINWDSIQPKEELDIILKELSEELNALCIPESLRNVPVATLNKRMGALQSKVDEVESDEFEVEVESESEDKCKCKCKCDDLRHQIKDATNKLISWALPLRKGRDQLKAKFDLLKEPPVRDDTLSSLTLKSDLYSAEQQVKDNVSEIVLDPEDSMDNLKKQLVNGVSTDFTLEMGRNLTKYSKQLSVLRDELKLTASTPGGSGESFNIGTVVDQLCDCPLIDEEGAKAYGMEGDYRLVSDTLVEGIIHHFEHGQDTWSLMSRIAGLEQQVETLTVVKNNAIVWRKLELLRYMELTDKIETLKKRLQSVEYYEMQAELEAHEYNDAILQDLDALKARLIRAEKIAGMGAVKQQIDEINQMLAYYEIQEDMDAAKLNCKYLKDKEDLDELRREHIELKQDLENQSRWETFQELSSLIESYSANQQADLLQTEILKLKAVHTEAKRTLLVTKQEIKSIGDKIALMEFKLEQQGKYIKDVHTLTDELLGYEQELKLYGDYNILMGSKGIASKMLYEKIKSIETYINSILKTFTRYSISIMFDDKKQTMLIIADDIDTGKSLSTTRFSGYEKLMLQLAFKRALNKYSYNSKSSLIIIDEALDCIDMDNFQAKLPDVMNMITQDYSTCLAISQRDISHISDNNMFIIKDKDTGASRLKGHNG
jgi:DNA repair exonuclease SbcCD ATPase subunit/DNA repair exonuclease SbcCD nuclease subunit